MAVAKIPHCLLPTGPAARMSMHERAHGRQAMERLLHQKFAEFSPVFKFPNDGQPGVPPFLQQHCSKPAASQIRSSFTLWCTPFESPCVCLCVTMLIRDFPICLH